MYKLYRSLRWFVRGAGLFEASRGAGAQGIQGMRLVVGPIPTRVNETFI